MDMKERINGLVRMANSLPTGYLKHNKAYDMLMTLDSNPAIKQDYYRFSAFVAGALINEGFNEADREIVLNYLIGEKIS